MIEGYEHNPAARLEQAFLQIAQESMVDLPFYRAQLPVKACGFHLFEGQWFGAIVTPWMLQLMLLPGPGQRWQRRKAEERVALSLPRGEMLFRPGEIAPDLHYLSCSLMSPMETTLTAGRAIELAENCAKLAIALPVRTSDDVDRGRRALFGGKHLSSLQEQA